MKRKKFKFVIELYYTKKTEVKYFDDLFEMFFPLMQVINREIKEITILKLEGRKYKEYMHLWLSKREIIPVPTLKPITLEEFVKNSKNFREGREK